VKRTPFLVVAAFLALAPRPASAQQVFSGDPVDPGTSLAFPIMPGLPLLLPGNDKHFGTGDDVINTMLTGDVDLVVRSGNVVSAAIPPPALAAGGPAIATVVAGGGSTGQGAEATFTAMVSSGTGSPPYGNVITNSDMDLRPVTIYAFADLDNDGIIGPTNADGSADNALELQEVTAYAGRQMGGLGAGRFTDSVGIEMGAPASIGGLKVALVAGAYTGTDPQELFTDGPLILTHWPFFPPLDPKDLLGGGNAPAPEPNQPNQLEWDIERNYLPAPGHPVLGTPFALAVNGSEATTDQLIVDSGSAVSARVFSTPAAGNFVARARPRLRVAPAPAGGGRALVLPVERAVLAADGATSQLSLRVLPVDLFANVADPAAPVVVTLSVSGPASIVSPDTDANDKTETVSLGDARGVQVVLDDDGSGPATLRLAIGGAPVESVALSVGAASDSDGDGVADDGNASGASGDKACDAATLSCDDNCPRVINPSQVDSDHDGIGDCCDGTCLLDPLSTSCDECALPAAPTSTMLTGVKASVRLGGGTSDDKLKFKIGFELAPGASISPDTETVSLIVTQAGSGGYSATLPSLFTDLLRSTPSFRYDDRNGAVDGVIKGQIKGRADGTWKMLLRAKGLSLADLAGGGAQLTVALGDDLFSGTLVCAGTAPRVDCELVP
jgi:hypothetical protein